MECEIYELRKKQNDSLSVIFLFLIHELIHSFSNAFTIHHRYFRILMHVTSKKKSFTNNPFDKQYFLSPKDHSINNV